MATIEEMLLKAAEVRNERGAGQNTAVRIGDVLLCAATLIQALQEGLDAETTARSGGDAGLGGQIASETASRQAADAVLAGQIYSETANRVAALQEVIGRILGTSDASSAYTDPLVLLGTFNNYADLNAALDAIGSSTDDGIERKHVGWCRAIVQGTPSFVLTTVLSWSEQKYGQIIMGNVQVSSGGSGVNRSDTPGLLGRSRTGSSWSAWVPIGGGGGDLSAYLTKAEAEVTYASRTLLNSLLAHFSSGSGAKGAVVFGTDFGIGSSAFQTKFFGSVNFGEGNMAHNIVFLANAIVDFWGKTTLPDDSYSRKNGELYPLSHPDLNTQGSILPQRFGNLKIYEKLIYVGGVDGSMFYFSGMPKDAMPIKVSVFGKGYEGNSCLICGGSLFFREDPGAWAFQSQLCSTDGKPVRDVYVLVQYYLPEGGGYYY